MIFRDIDIPNEIIEPARSGNLVVFAGAGASNK